MNKRDAQQHLVAYKDNQREKEYALQHGVLSNFKAKYLEKIPLGNGKFRYVYEEAKDKVKSTASNVANKLSSKAPGSNVSSNSARSQANTSEGATKLNDSVPNENDARMQFARQAVAENQNKIDRQKNAKPTGANRADKIESQRDNQDPTRSIEAEKNAESNARKYAIEAINKRSVEKSINDRTISLQSRAIRDILGDDYSESGNMILTGENSKIGKLISDRTKKASDETKKNIKSAVDGGIIAESSKNRIMKVYHNVETRTYENKIEYGHEDPKTHEFVLDHMESKKYPGDDGKLLTSSERYKNQYMKEMLGAMNLSRYGDFEIKNGKVVVKSPKGSDASKEQLYFAKVLDKQLSEMYEKATRVD